MSFILEREDSDWWELKVEGGKLNPWPYLSGDDPHNMGCPSPPGSSIGLFFQGSKLTHWRDPLPSGTQLGAFFFWVDLDGPFANLANDALKSKYPATYE